MNDGLAAMQRKQFDKAERLLLAAIHEEPRAKEAYNNLGKIYAERGDTARARSMFEAAIAVDPTYVFPRVNIALFRLADDDIDGAEDILRPLADKQRFLPNELAFYQFGMARVAVARERYDDARRLLTGVPGGRPRLRAGPGAVGTIGAHRNGIEVAHRFRGI